MLTGSLIITVLGPAPGATATPTGSEGSSPKASGTFGAPVRLGKTEGESYGLAMNSRGDAVALGLDLNPRVGPDGNTPVGSASANIVYRYVGGTWQDPEVIPAPMFTGNIVEPNWGGSNGTNKPALAMSDAGHAVIVLPGAGTNKVTGQVPDYGIFISTSHDITQADSFTPWQRITPPKGTIDAGHVPSVVVTDAGDVVVTYDSFFFGDADGCTGATYAMVGKISASGFVQNESKGISSCLAVVPNGYWRNSQVDVSLTGTVATVASLNSNPKCDPKFFCTWVDLTTYDTTTGSWGPTTQVLPILRSAGGNDDGWYLEPHVATSIGGTTVMAHVVGSSTTTKSVRYNTAGPGAMPNPNGVRSLGTGGEWYQTADVVMATDGQALAVFEVGCDTCGATYTRRFEALEIGSASQRTLALGAPVESATRQTNRPRITVALPRSATSLSSAVVAYTEANLTGVPRQGRIFVNEWPFTSPAQELPATQGPVTNPLTAPIAPAIGVASSGAALVAFRPDEERVSWDFGYEDVSRELWVSGRATANATGLFPPTHVRATVNPTLANPKFSEITVSLIRPYFYPDGGGDGGYFAGWRGIGAIAERARYEIYVETGPPGFTVPATPLCSGRFWADLRGRGHRDVAKCVVSASLPSGAYTFSARTTLDGRTSARSAPTAPVDYTAPPGVPSAPTEVVGVAGDRQVTVTWKAPASDGGSPITMYDVLASPGNGGCRAEGALTCTVTGLTNGTAYTFTVTAWNDSGPSPVSAPSAPVTPGGTLSSPTSVTATAGNAQATVSWRAPTSTGGATITRYTVTSSPDGRLCTTTGALTCTVTGLTNGTAYTFTVTASTATTTSPPSAPSAPVTPAAAATSTPGAVSGFSVGRFTKRGQTYRVVVRWKPPADDGGAQILGYVVRVGSGARWSTWTEVDGPTAVLSGLARGTRYRLQVQALNVNGSGATASYSFTSPRR